MVSHSYSHPTQYHVALLLLIAINFVTRWVLISVPSMTLGLWNSDICRCHTEAVVNGLNFLREVSSDTKEVDLQGTQYNALHVYVHNETLHLLQCLCYSWIMCRSYTDLFHWYQHPHHHRLECSVITVRDSCHYYFCHNYANYLIIHVLPNLHCTVWLYRVTA